MISVPPVEIALGIASYIYEHVDAALADGLGYETKPFDAPHDRHDDHSSQRVRFRNRITQREYTGE